MRLVKTLPILLSLGAALGSVSAWALPNDQQQPIRIQADDAQLDDKNGIATYKGDVIITQGSMIVKGNTVTITGANFTGATAVTFGVTPATSFTVNSDTQITATVPFYASSLIGSIAGTDVIVTTAGGDSDTSG